MLHGVLDELLPHPGGAADADALDALLAGEDADALWNEPALFGSLAPGLQCSEACHRPGQRCLDPTHTAHCTKCVPPRQGPCRARAARSGLRKPDVLFAAGVFRRRRAVAGARVFCASHAAVPTPASRQAAQAHGADTALRGALGRNAWRHLPPPPTNLLTMRRRCIASPCEADVGVYELVGEVGKKNGEKRLRCVRSNDVALRGLG